MSSRKLALVCATVIIGCGAIAPAFSQGASKEWTRAPLEGVEIEYQVRGTGEPVVFVHAGVFAEWFEPLLKEAALRARYRLITYHRVGYAGSARVTGAVSIGQQAAQLRALLRRLGIERAHVVGHSSGGLIALQLALDAPESVQSLALLEPALSVRGTSASPTPAPRSGVVTAIERYRAGDRPGAVDTFLRTVAGAEYRAALDQALPQAFAHAVNDAATFFEQELPAVQAWSFREEDARRVRQPVLAVMGARSSAVSPIWQQRQNLLLAWFPDAEPFELAGATHLLHVQNPHDMAERLAAFFARHSFPTPTSRSQ
jgi:pimeloyl-ACP methyl ester carboxylesterase